MERKNLIEQMKEPLLARSLFVTQVLRLRCHGFYVIIRCHGYWTYLHFLWPHPFWLERPSPALLSLAPACVRNTHTHTNTHREKFFQIKLKFIHTIDASFFYQGQMSNNHNIFQFNFRIASPIIYCITPTWHQQCVSNFSSSVKYYKHKQRLDTHP